MLTSELIKKKAKEYGADLCGIGDISLYEGTDMQHDPRMILPEAKCVIGFGFRVPQGLYLGMERGTQYFNYTSLGVKYLDEEFAEIFLLKMGALIEDEGYDACLQRNVSNLKVKGDKTQNPELVDTYELIHTVPVAPGKPVPDVIMDFGQSAVICGLGSLSIKGNVITPEFGPFIRLAFIVTDAPLQVDETFHGNLCDKCGECVKACPGKAVSLEDGLDTWQCSVYYRGAHKSNPFMKEDFLKNNPDRVKILNGDMRFDSTSAREIYPYLDFLPSQFTGYAPCLCGKKCDIVCFNHLKRRGII